MLLLLLLVLLLLLLLLLLVLLWFEFMSVCLAASAPHAVPNVSMTLL
jgi:hypothetical protein